METKNKETILKAKTYVEEAIEHLFTEICNQEQLSSGDMSPSDDNTLCIITEKLSAIVYRYIWYNKTNGIWETNPKNLTDKELFKLINDN